MSHYPAARFLISVAPGSAMPADEGGEVAMAGRSNAGKSSAINAMTARRALARTSRTPGRTRLLNFFELWPGARLVDLPGYGYASGPREEREAWRGLIEALAPRRALRGLMLVVDARRGLQALDEQLLAWATDIGCPVHVLLSKVDQLRRAEAEAVLRQSSATLGASGSVQLFSAHSGAGVADARRVLDDWLGRGPAGRADRASVAGAAGAEGNAQKKMPRQLR